MLIDIQSCKECPYIEYHNLNGIIYVPKCKRKSKFLKIKESSQNSIIPLFQGNIPNWCTIVKDKK